MEKNIKDYLHLYLGCETNYGKLIGVCNWAAYTLMKDDTVQAGSVENIKPILRPLSDMIDDERAEYDEIQVKCHSVNPFYDQVRTDALLTEFLFSKHFDLFGLIEAGLAIDATTIKELNKQP